MTSRWIAMLGGVGCLFPTLAAAEPSPNCVAAGVGDEPELMALTGNKVAFCFDYSGTPLCHATDLTTGQTVGTPAAKAGDTPRVVAAASAPKIRVGDDAAEVCHADNKCVTITAKSKVDPGLGMLAAANEAGTLLAVSSTTWIETWDLATKKRIAKFTTGAKKSSCNWLEWAGDTLVVSERECGKPSGTAWLATKAGKKLAAVGGAKPLESSSMTHVKDAVWAFDAFAGDAVVEQDVKTGKVVKTLALGAAAADASSWIVGDGAHLAVVFGGSRAGDIAVIDAATDKVASYAGKRCSP